MGVHLASKLSCCYHVCMSSDECFLAKRNSLEVLAKYCDPRTDLTLVHFQLKTKIKDTSTKEINANF